MSSYDPTIFERSDTNFILSQRFKQHFHKFYGTLKVALQMVSTNVVLGRFPRPLVYAIMFIYLVVGLILARHVVTQLRSEKAPEFEDFDLIDINNPRHKVLSRLDRGEFMFVSFVVFLFVIILVTIVEKMGIRLLIFYCTVLISYILINCVPQIASVLPRKRRGRRLSAKGPEAPPSTY